MLIKNSDDVFHTVHAYGSDQKTVLEVVVTAGEESRVDFVLGGEG